MLGLLWCVVGGLLLTAPWGATATQQKIVHATDTLDAVSLVELEAEFGAVVQESRQMNRLGDALALLASDEFSPDEDEGFNTNDSAEIDDADDQPGDESTINLDHPVHTTQSPPFKLPPAVNGAVNDSVAKAFGLPTINSIPLSMVFQDRMLATLTNFSVGAMNETDTTEASAPPPQQQRTTGSAATATQPVFPNRVGVPIQRSREMSVARDQGDHRFRLGVREGKLTNPAAAAKSLAAFLELEETTQSKNADIPAGMVADYNFASEKLASQGGTARDLVDIGKSCKHEARFVDANINGKNQKVLNFDKGTGFFMPDVQDLLGSGSESRYTIVIRAKLDQTAPFRRLLNVKYGDDHGIYVDKVLRVAPDRGGTHVVSPEEWHDIVIMYADGYCKLMLDGMVDKSWQVNPQNRGLKIESKSLVFFNDDGEACSNNPENTAGQVARIMVFDRLIEEHFIPALLDTESVDAPPAGNAEYYSYEYYDDCVCPPADSKDKEEGRLKCLCTSVCECRGPPTIPPPPRVEWDFVTASTWVWRYRPHNAWAGWYGNQFHALAGGSSVPMNMLLKFNNLRGRFGSQRMKVWRAELFLFFARRVRAHRISGFPLTTNWNAWSTSWNNGPASESGAVFTTYIGNLNRNQWAVCVGGGLAQLVEQWINGDRPNYGLVVAVTSESGRRLYDFSIVAGRSHRGLQPRLRIWMSPWG